MLESGQRVALKVLHGQITAGPELLSELQREFQLLQSLSHPNIVRAPTWTGTATLHSSRWSTCEACP